MADFVVSVLTVTVASVLSLLTVGIIVAAFKGGEVKSYFTIITSIITSIISALVGFLAGKGVGKSDKDV